MKKALMIVGLLVIAGTAVAAVSMTDGEGGEPTFRTAKIERGNLSKSVSASGELNPVITVEVGSEISGQISGLLADFNSEVKVSQVIARIDPESFQAEVRRSEAELAVALKDLSEDKVVHVAVHVAVALHCFVVRFNSGELYAVKKLYFLLFV